MSALAALAANWRYAAVGLMLVAVAVFAWRANGWRHDAEKLPAARAALAAEQKARIEADAARIDLARKLATAETRFASTTKAIVQKVRIHVPSDRNCDLPDSVRELLAHARAGVPAATGDSATAAPDP